MTKKQKTSYFFLYSALFCVMAFAVYGWLWLQGKTFVGREDGFYQHYHALTYYGKWLRGILKTLFTEGRLSFPEWDFSIGYGSNVWTTFHYYVIGDPLALLSAFVPSRYTLYLYCFLVLLRNYLAGLSFSCFCFYLGRRRPVAVLAGAFTYVFCAWALLVGTRHPFFTNPMIYFPLVLLGLEKILRREKPYVYILSVFVSAASNFYFFYMIALLTAVYALVRVCVLYGWKGRGKALAAVLKLAGFALVGTMLAAVILLPEMLLFAQDYRSEIAYTVPKLYTLSYYKTFLAVFAGSVSTENYTLMGFGVPVMLTAVLLFLPGSGIKGGQSAGEEAAAARRTERTLFVLGTVFLLLPAAAYVLNGFSYVANRWEWGYSLLAAFILTERWEELFCQSRRRLLLLSAGAAAYILAYRNYKDLLFLFALLPAALLVMLAGSQRNGSLSRRESRCGGSTCGIRPMDGKRGMLVPQLLMLIIVLAGLSWNAYRQYGEGTGGAMSTELMSRSQVRKREKNNPDGAIRSLMEEDGSFWRYSGKNLQMNSAPVNGTRNTQFYWSLSNGNLSRFFVELEMRVTRLYMYGNLDDRTMADSLAGVRYYTAEEGEESGVPFGYSLKETVGDTQVYENQNALPLAYTYDSCVTEEELEGLNGVQKEEAMAQSIVLETAADGIAKGDPEHTGHEAGYTLSCGEGVELTENGFLVTEDKAQATLEVTGDTAGELYLRLTGYEYQGEADSANLTAACVREDGTKTAKALRYYPATYARPSQMHDYMFNLNYSESRAKTVTLTFQKKGTYVFDTLSLYVQPLEQYETYMEERAADAWESEIIGVDTVQGQVTLTEDKMLLLTIPYDGGWTAWVDGEKTELVKANYAFGALKVPAGEHTIVLTYRTPGLAAGALLSAGAVLILAGIWISLNKTLWKREFFAHLSSRARK